MTDQNKIWLLIARNLSGEANAEEISAFNQLLKDDPEIQQQYEYMLALWQSPANSPHETSEHYDEILNRLTTSNEDESLVMFEKNVLKIKKRNRLRWLVAASVAGIAIFLLFNYNLFESSSPIATKVIEAPNGSRIKSQLHDG